MKMTSAEKVFLDKIIADSGEEISVVRNVLRAVLISILKEVYACYGNSDDKDKTTTEFYLPYIAKLVFNCKNVLTKDEGEKTQIEIQCTPAITLEKEINRIFSNESLEMEEFFKQEICLNLLKILDFDKDSIIEE
jgi:hypothetical protein